MSCLRRFGKYAVDLEKVVIATPELVILDGVGVVKMDAESAEALLAAVPEWKADILKATGVVEWDRTFHTIRVGAEWWKRDEQWRNHWLEWLPRWQKNNALSQLGDGFGIFERGRSHRI